MKEDKCIDTTFSRRKKEKMLKNIIETKEFSLRLPLRSRKKSTRILQKNIKIPFLGDSKSGK